MQIDLLHRCLFPLLWIAWAAYWWASARDVKTTVRRESLGSRALHMGPLLFAAFLMWTPRWTPRWTPHPGLSWLGDRFLPEAEWPFWVGAAITTAALLFAVWARRHIGRNWSAIVTLKEDHELVTSGPYAIVRHPIYTGLLFGFAGSALALGEGRGLVAVAIVHLSLWRKYRLEERWMRERFGAIYEEYSTRVKALVPFVV